MNSLVVEIQEARARSASVSDEALTVDLMDGRTIVVPLVWYPRLWHGTPQERNHFEIFGDGIYIHWPELDEDLTVAGLLGGRRSGESSGSFQKWLDVRVGKQSERGQGPSNKALQPTSRAGRLSKARPASRTARG